MSHTGESFNNPKLKHVNTRDSAAICVTAQMKEHAYEGGGADVGEGHKLERKLEKRLGKVQLVICTCLPANCLQ